MRGFGAALLVCVALAALPGATAAATATVEIGSNAFLPDNVTIAQGGSVRWHNGSFLSHDADSVNGCSGAGSGELAKAGGLDYWCTAILGGNGSATRVFPAAGSFGYLCTFHAGMTGTVRVPVRGSKSVVGGVTHFTIRIATAALPSGSPFQYLVYKKGPSDSDLQPWKTTRNATVSFKPTAHGTYQFASRVQRVANGAASGLSPVKSLSY